VAQAGVFVWILTYNLEERRQASFSLPIMARGHRLVLILALVAASAVSAERLRKQKADPTPEQVAATMDRLGPVLEKLKGLDPKSFGALSGMMNQVQGSAKPSSFLQFVKDDPNAVQDKMAALEPILDKLRNLDPKAFGALNGLVNQAQTPQAPQKPSLIQRTDPAKAEDQQVDVSGTIDKLQPVLDKLRNLDPKAFGAMSNMIDQASKDGNQK